MSAHCQRYSVSYLMQIIKKNPKKIVKCRKLVLKSKTWFWLDCSRCTYQHQSVAENQRCIVNDAALYWVAAVFCNFTASTCIVFLICVMKIYRDLYKLLQYLLYNHMYYLLLCFILNCALSKCFNTILCTNSFYNLLCAMI